MRKFSAILLLVLIGAVPALAGNKQKGAATLKDFQPAGTPDKKQKQQYDFIFDATGTEYTCRSSAGTKLSATDFPVNSQITYEIDKDKGKVKTTAGKETKCTVVRVEHISDTPRADAPR
jgi:hypothetical protein